MDLMMTGVVWMGICAVLLVLLSMAMRQRAREARCKDEAAEPIQPPPPVFVERPPPDHQRVQRALRVARIQAERRAWKLAMDLARDRAVSMAFQDAEADRANRASPAL